MKQAFTLIELLVVVLIIGILSAVALPQYQVAVTKARFLEVKIAAETAAKAEELYYMANGTYTDNGNDLDIFTGNVSPSDSHNISFKNGYCYLSASGGSEKRIFCSAYSLTYEIHLVHSKVNPNTRTCWARANNSIANRVCKSETGLSTPTNSTGTQNTYDYP